MFYIFAGRKDSGRRKESGRERAQGRAAGQVRVPDQDRTEGGSHREHQVTIFLSVRPSYSANL